MRRLFSQDVFMLVVALSIVLFVSGLELNAPIYRIAPSSALAPALPPLAVVPAGNTTRPSFLEDLGQTRLPSLTLNKGLITGAKNVYISALDAVKKIVNDSHPMKANLDLVDPIIKELTDALADYAATANSNHHNEAAHMAALDPVRTKLINAVDAVCDSAEADVCKKVGLLKTKLDHFITLSRDRIPLVNVHVPATLAASPNSWMIHGLWDGAGLASHYVYAADSTAAAIRASSPTATTRWPDCKNIGNDVAQSTFWETEWKKHGSKEGFGRPLLTYFEDALSLYATASDLCTRAAAAAATTVITNFDAEVKTTIDARKVTFTKSGDCTVPVTFTPDTWVRTAAPTTSTSATTSTLTLHKCPLLTRINAAADKFEKDLGTPTADHSTLRDTWVKEFVDAASASKTKVWTVKSLIPVSSETLPATSMTKELDTTLLRKHFNDADVLSTFWASCTATTQEEAWKTAWQSDGAPKFGHNSPGYFKEAISLREIMIGPCTAALDALVVGLKTNGAAIEFAKAKSGGSYVYTPKGVEYEGITISTRGECTVHFNWARSKWE